ncbi:MAG: hypothetical protein QF609_11040 [Gammaproteobacteria bacterium]|jgi:hypothetical protein|nr:hypothetical protein [Gammaproteobacteria bacterium]
MEEQTLVSREIVEGYLVEYYEVDDTIGFSVAITESAEIEFDSEDVTIPAYARTG